MAYVLSREKQFAAIHALCEGASIRAIERMTGVHRDTVMRLGARVEFVTDLANRRRSRIHLSNDGMTEFSAMVPSTLRRYSTRNARVDLPGCLRLVCGSQFVSLVTVLV